MWFEAIPSMAATFVCLSLVELAPAILHSISWGTPMKRAPYGEPWSMQLIRRDQRISDEAGVPWLAKHMYTFSFSNLTPEVQLSGNHPHYAEAEKLLAQRMDNAKQQ